MRGAAVIDAELAISRRIWDMKYRLRATDGTAREAAMSDTWRRVARALAAPETEALRAVWEEQFFALLASGTFLPAGRILAGAGTGRNVTLFNCFVMGTIPDDMGGIFSHLREAALTLQQGGGIGYDFSTLRPRGAVVHGVGADASGPVPFMDVWDAMCRTIMSAGARRGAMMATLRCDHPDIEEFIDAKRQPGRLRMFNLSVLVSDAFMMAVREDRHWPLRFAGETCRSLPARRLWARIMESAYACGEPGVIFIDRVNAANSLRYAETIHATNPCGEQPLPPYGTCLLGSINLARLVRQPFTEAAALDLDQLQALVPVAVRLLDNVIDVSGFPLPQQADEARAKRRLGLGVTGLADALLMCRVRYGSEAAATLTGQWLAAIRNTAARASAALAAEKGPFPLYAAEPYGAAPMIRTLDAAAQAAIARYGIRNALLTSIAPTGTISLLAGNVSSGIEPIFALSFQRTLLLPDGHREHEEVEDYAWHLFRRRFGPETPPPDWCVTAQDLTPDAHLRMQAAAQPHVDSAISKTINCPENIEFSTFQDIYQRAYDLGCKGCTAFRPNTITGVVLAAGREEPLAYLQAGAESTTPGRRLGRGGREEAVAGGALFGHAVEVEVETETEAETRPYSRPDTLPGKTYKIRWPDSDHALYITVNDIIHHGRRRPFEVFINSKNMEHYAWTVALTRMISAVFRRGGDVSFVVEELKAVFDPRGGHWVNGRYVPSLLAAIGEVIERHMVDTGFLASDPVRDTHASTECSGRPSTTSFAPLPSISRRAILCPRCGQPGVLRQEDCDMCPSCGYSHCG